MNKFNKKSISVLAIVFMFGLFGMSVVSAASPSLGVAGTYGVLSGTYTNTTNTTINGDVGFTTPPAVAPVGSHIFYGHDAPYASAGIDQGSALSNLASLPCTKTFPLGAIDLATDTTHGTMGIYTPGVYCGGASSAISIGTAGITLSGSGTYVFRINGALTTVDNSIVKLSGGASSCDIFWTPTAATTLGANTTFIGTDIDDSGITVGANTTWNGRALAFGGTVTTDTDMITNTCGVTPAPTRRSTSSGSSVVSSYVAPVTVTPVIVAAVVAPTVVEAVITTVPKLPNTGFPPQDKNTPWYIVLFSDIINMLFK